MAGEVWDWPNQQVVRSDGTGPGFDTPVDSPTGARITYGHVGMAYQFLLKLSDDGDVTGHGTVDWDFGDGATEEDVDSTVPVNHTYDEAGTYSVRAYIGQAVRSVTINVDEPIIVEPAKA